MDNRRELQRLGIRLQGALTAYGAFRMAPGGIPNQVNFKRVYTYKNQPYGLFEVDVANLPMGVHPETLSNPAIEQFLSTAIGHPVKAMNGQSLTYCVRLSPPSATA